MERRGTEHMHSSDPGTFSSARRSVQDRLSVRGVLMAMGGAIAFIVAVGLVMYFKPGSTNEPKGEPALDFFGVGPVEDFLPGSMTFFENENIFLVRLEDGGVFALYDLAPHIQARVAAGDLEAIECRAVMRSDDEMAGWLAQAGPPSGFEDRGIWEECSGVAWDATGRQVHGPESGNLDRFTVAIVDGIMRVDLSDRVCANPIRPESPCIVTQ